MILGDVMDEIRDVLATIPGLRAYAFPPDKLAPPAAVVVMPDEIEYDATYGRGSDRISLGVLVVVGKASSRAARDNLVGYADGAGTKSFKAACNGHAWTSCDSVRVTSCSFDVVSVAGVDMSAALFELDIIGKG